MIIRGLDFYSGLVATLLLFDVAVPGDSITSGRATSLLFASFSLFAVVIGGLAYKRATERRGSGRIGGIIAFALGLIAAVANVIHLAGSTGFGTGGGRAGAIIGLVLAVVGLFFGVLAIKGRSAAPA